MRDLNGGYALSFNQRHEREGPLYQGRFKSVLVENDSHSWELSRYVHLNPYRAGLTRDPFQYRWSSYRFYLNSTRKPDWLDTQTVLAEFGGTAAGARLAYKRFVEAGMQTAPTNRLAPSEKTGILGSPEFIRMRQEWLTPRTIRALTLEDIVTSVCTEFATTLAALSRKGQHDHTPRDAAVLLARESLTEALDKLAATFGGVSRSSISEIAKRARERETTDPTFRRKLEAIREQWR